MCEIPDGRTVENSWVIKNVGYMRRILLLLSDLYSNSVILYTWITVEAMENSENHWRWKLEGEWLAKNTKSIIIIIYYGTYFVMDWCMSELLGKVGGSLTGN